MYGRGVLLHCSTTVPLFITVRMYGCTDQLLLPIHHCSRISAVHLLLYCSQYCSLVSYCCDVRHCSRTICVIRF
uniref:Uncharacterized protein n=1 Tax=Arundo donax TaxID=35708 RepID=A0A0A9H194_ARUDO